MLLNPKKHSQYREFLDDLYQKLRFLMEQRREEFRWSVVLDFLLLKTLGDNIFSKYLEEKLEETFVNYRAIMNFELRESTQKRFGRMFGQKHSHLHPFFDNNKVTPQILRKSLYEMRTDMDLKILFTLFGGKFYPQEQINYDGTGSLYFTNYDFKETENYIKKLKIMENHLKNVKENNIPCIALNMGFHWVAITKVGTKTQIIKYNNPLGRREVIRRISPAISEEYRFYLFTHNPDKAFILTAEGKEFLTKQLDNLEKSK